MADGTKLATSIWLPKGAGPFPVILIRTPYGRKRLAAEELRYVRRGYALWPRMCGAGRIRKGVAALCP